MGARGKQSEQTLSEDSFIFWCTVRPLMLVGFAVLLWRYPPSSTLEWLLVMCGVVALYEVIYRQLGVKWLKQIPCRFDSSQS